MPHLKSDNYFVTKTAMESAAQGDALLARARRTAEHSRVLAVRSLSLFLSTLSGWGAEPCRSLAETCALRARAP